LDLSVDGEGTERSGRVRIGGVTLDDSDDG
jgi:hypothetical protein